MTILTGSQATTQLKLFAPSCACLPVQVVDLVFALHGETHSECRLTIRVKAEQYRQIENDALFHLVRVVRSSLHPIDLASSADIDIEVSLQAPLLPHLAAAATDAETALAYLVACSQESSDASPENTAASWMDDAADDSWPPPVNPLLLTESWFALRVTQSPEGNEVGYRTLWSYLDPADLDPAALADNPFLAAMTRFLNDREDADTTLAEEALSTVFDTLSDKFAIFDGLNLLTDTGNAITEIFEGLSQAIDEWAEQPSAASAQSTDRPIYKTMMGFFAADDWEFSRIKGEHTLRVVAEGAHGRWDCYATALDEQAQFVFYSVCPVLVPAARRLLVADLLIRANQELLIGNFDINLADGVIRYRTSIDVTGDRLTPALLKQLVSHNVRTMDQSLPSIMALVGNDVAPAEANSSPRKLKEERRSGLMEHHNGTAMT